MTWWKGALAALVLVPMVTFAVAAVSRPAPEPRQRAPIEVTSDAVPSEGSGGSEPTSGPSVRPSTPPSPRPTARPTQKSPNPQSDKPQVVYPDPDDLDDDDDDRDDRDDDRGDDD